MQCRLHQSVGPSSVLLSSTDESGARPLVARLWDLAFSVDVSDAALFGGATLADVWERGRIDTEDPLCAPKNLGFACPHPCLPRRRGSGLRLHRRQGPPVPGLHLLLI